MLNWYDCDYVGLSVSAMLRIPFQVLFCVPTLLDFLLGSMTCLFFVDIDTGSCDDIWL